MTLLSDLYLTALDLELAKEPDRGYRAAQLHREYAAVEKAYRDRLDRLQEENRREIREAADAIEAMDQRAKTEVA